MSAHSHTLRRYAYDNADLGTILAALRYWQQSGLADNPNLRSDELHAIATCDDDETSLDGARVDELCVALNRDFDLFAKATGGAS